MSYLREAHARMLAALAANAPRAIPPSPDPEDFTDRRDHMAAIAAAVSDYFFACANDAAPHAPDAIKPKEFVGVVSVALTDNDLLSQFDDAAEQLQQWQDERNADPRGWSKAEMAGVS